MCMNKVLAALSSAVLPLTGRLVIGKIDADQRSMRSNDRIDLYLMTTLLPCEYESVDTPEHSSETAGTCHENHGVCHTYSILYIGKYGLGNTR